MPGSLMGRQVRRRLSRGRSEPARPLHPAESDVLRHLHLRSRGLVPCGGDQAGKSGGAGARPSTAPVPVGRAVPGGVSAWTAPGIPARHPASRRDSPSDPSRGFFLRLRQPPAASSSRLAWRRVPPPRLPGEPAPFLSGRPFRREGRRNDAVSAQALDEANMASSPFPPLTSGACGSGCRSQKNSTAAKPQTLT